MVGILIEAKDGDRDLSITLEVTPSEIDGGASPELAEGRVEWWTLPDSNRPPPRPAYAFRFGGQVQTPKVPVGGLEGT